MGLFDSLFHSDKIDALTRDRDYYKSLYEQKLEDMDAMRRSLYDCKNKCEILEAHLAVLQNQVKQYEENKPDEIVPDKELLF